MKKSILILIVLISIITTYSNEIRTEVYPPQDMQVNKDTSIYIKFNTQMNPDFINRFTFILNDGVSDIKGKVIYNQDETTAYFIPNNYLKPGTNYKVMLYKGVEAQDGEKVKENVVWSFRVVPDNVVVSTLSDMQVDIEDKLIKKKEFLEVISTKPENTEIIKKTIPIVIKFSGPIDEKTVNKYTFMVRNEKKKWEGKIDIVDNKVTFMPFHPFDLDSQYNVILTNFIKDINGKSLIETYEFTFRTSKIKYEEFPEVIESYPSDKEYNIAPNASIVIKFNKKMDPASLNRFNVLLHNGVKNVWGDIKYNEKDRVLVFDPENDLPINARCKFKIRKTVRDLEGKYMQKDFETEFSTGSEKVIELAPEYAKEEEAQKKEDTLEIEDPQEDEIYTERYRIKSDNMFFVKEYFPKDRELSIAIDTKIKIQFSMAARASTVNEFNITLSDGVKTLWGDVIYDNKSFTAWFSPKDPLRNNTLYYLRVSDKIKDLNGNNLDRFYESTFITEPLPDRVSPQISEVFPGDKSFDNPQDIMIKVRFNEEIREESLNKFTVRVSDGKEYIERDISYDKEKDIAFIHPVKRLKEHGLYKVIIGPAVSDIAGNFMEKAVEWSFWVGSPPDEIRPSILAISPRENAPVYTTKPIVSVTFSEEMDTKTLTPFNFGLMKDNRPVKGILKYNDITNKLYYEYHEELEYGQLYTVFITSRVRDLAGNFFGKNIAWDFIISHKEKTLPEVTATYPFAEKTNFSVNGEMFIQFNKDMNPVSMNRFTVKLKDINGRFVSGEIVYDTNKRELIFRPYKSLEFNSRYLMTISKYVQDTEGKNMEKDYELIFYTEGRGHNEDEK